MHVKVCINWRLRVVSLVCSSIYTQEHLQKSLKKCVVTAYNIKSEKTLTYL